MRRALFGRAPAFNRRSRARVGTNIGEVVVSIRTGEQHSEYAPVGHTANLASRMQTIATSGSIVVTANTSHSWRVTLGYARLAR